jgi:choline dehydrogenase-like flavoprotein
MSQVLLLSTHAHAAHFPVGRWNGAWSAVSSEISSFDIISGKALFHHSISARVRGEIADDELKVYSFSNLRVADASVFPSVSAARPRAP